MKLDVLCHTMTSYHGIDGIAVIVIPTVAICLSIDLFRNFFVGITSISKLGVDTSL